MLVTILSLYLQGLFFAIILVGFASLIWFLLRARKGIDRTVQERQEFLFDVLLIQVMTVPIVAFGMVGILLMIKA